MRNCIAVLCVLALASCGPKPVVLPTDRVDEAAYCAAAAAEMDRPDAFPEYPVQFLLLGALDGVRLDHGRYSAAALKMAPYKVAMSRDESAAAILQACNAKYPFVRPSTVVELPADPKERAFGCHTLVDSLGVSISATAGPRMDRIKYSVASHAMYAATLKFKKDEGMSWDDYNLLHNSLRESMLKRGNAVKVLEACQKAFPEVLVAPRTKGV